MGIQTMTSQGGSGQLSQIQSLARQGSLYSLTLNEVQTHLGEPLHSMNLEELLKGLDAEQSLAVDGPSGGDQYASGSGIQHQGSVTMSRTLTKKTVEEVWRDIQQGINKGGEGRRSAQERRPTLGEMTLEDFLAKAGVMPEGSGAGSGKGRDNVTTAPPEYTQGTHWLYQKMPAMDQQSVMAGYLPGCGVSQIMASGSGPMLEATYPEGQMSLSPPMLGVTSDSQTPGKKRGHSADMDKMVERRQKRMIKNRESAARSRARKQAYTNELENKVSRLEEENERLKKQKELDKLLYIPPPEPKYQLRRTSSASF
ncbi:ABSCISIC ACID-INSENSITIVE 5-like protein 2 [Iris pallida]|uniref:ABSCISIC ACID-INSENSITIVE 5-like protein 2 n=1 Tax=Iris pallida TaxID=29817 RepID=A0AAX6EHT4_IRIPA|nr:ABSCISIC ACID-INSENSITIVE 5-like protein 2 [Iris pallida]KAJ6844337.1 ABSCISIC ACID-INSENSITIVE 5-like protein 2 [Iris pallida]